MALIKSSKVLIDPENGFGISKRKSKDWGAGGGRGDGSGGSDGGGGGAEAVGVGPELVEGEGVEVGVDDGDGIMTVKYAVRARPLARGIPANNCRLYAPAEVEGGIIKEQDPETLGVVPTVEVQLPAYI